MPTPHFYGYPTIGSVMMGSRAIESFKYTDLTRAADLRGEDILVEALSGRQPTGRLEDDSRRIILVRLNGEWTEENVQVAGGYAGRMEAYYGYLDKLKDLAAVKEAQDLTLTVGSMEWEGSCTVERMGEPERLNPWTYELALDLTLHGGELARVVAP